MHITSVIVLLLLNLFNWAHGVKIYRISNETIPRHYDIEIATEVDRNGFTFSGKVVIHLEAINITSKIELHRKQNEIISVEVASADGNEITVNTTTYDNETEIFTVNLEEDLAVGKLYYLRIIYSGILREDNLGFYRSSYLNGDGEKVWIAATQFAAVEARHAFPCYDEPRFKATFNIQITHPMDLVAISNMPLKSITKSSTDNMLTTAFEITPIMSTYLVAFVISNFNNSQLIKEQFTFEVYSRADALSRTKFAQASGAAVLQKFTNYFDRIPLPLTIMKQVAIPDFYFGAMENFGIVTYKESVLIFNEKLHGVQQKMGTMVTISHEMSHQWFGNMVTMDWWTYVWLNEGFATLYGYYGTDMVNPKWNIMEMYQIAVQQTAFSVDGQLAIRPMSAYVEKPKEIIRHYDRIAYEKASSVLRMFEQAIGKDVFEAGVMSYLEKAQYKTVTESDLFAALSEEMVARNLSSEIDLPKAMSSWTTQRGFPLLTVSFTSDTNEIIITQSRFLSTGDKERFQPTIWHIPITYETSDLKEANLTWMTEPLLQINLPTLPHKWVLLNIGQVGYYRVNYDLKNWANLIETLRRNSSEIPKANRAQLIDDAFHLARAKKLPYPVLFELLESLANETSYGPWAAFDRNIDQLRRLVSAFPEWEYFRNFMTRLFTPALEQIGYITVSNESPLRTITRKILLNHAGYFNASNCLLSTGLYDMVNMRHNFYCNNLRAEKLEVIKDMKDILKYENDQIVRSEILSAFGCYPKSDDGLQLLMAMAIHNPSELNLTPVERRTFLQNLYKDDRDGVFEMVLKFVALHSKTLERLLPSNGLDAIVNDFVNYVNSWQRAEMFSHAISKMNVSVRTADNANTIISSSMQWIADNQVAIDDWFHSGQRRSFAVNYFLNVFLLIIGICITIQM